MADAKEIEIKLKATGGQSAAKEVETVEKAVEDLAASAAETTVPQSDPASLVPAWDEVGEAVAEAGEKMDGTAGSAESLDDLLNDMKGRIGEARGALDDLSDAADNAAGRKGGGLGALIARFGPLIAQAGVVIGTIDAIASVLRRIDAAGEQAMGRFAASGERMARALENSDDRVADLAREITAAISPARTLASEVERFAAGQEAANATYEAGVAGTAKMASAYDDLAKSLIDLKVARGEMTKEEAAVAKGTLEVERLRREAADKVALAEREARSATAEARQARQAELDAQRRTVDAEHAVKEAGRSHRDRLARAGLQDANAAVIGGLSPFDPTAARQTVDLAGGEGAVKQMIAEMDGWAGYMARWRLWMGQSVESILGAGERAEISRMMAEEAAAEIEAAETNLKRAEEAAAKIAEEKARELETLRREREEADRQAKKAGAGVDRARADQKIVEDFAVPTARNRTSKELADIESENRERDRKAKEKEDREREKQQREEVKRRRDEQMAALQAEIKAAAPGFSDRAGRGEAAGFNEGAKAMESAAKGFADGAGMGELERVLFDTARVIEDAPKRQQAQLRLLLAPLEKAVADWQRRMEIIEQQIRNNPNRG